jgi:hypothetical protein
MLSKHCTTELYCSPIDAEFLFTNIFLEMFLLYFQKSFLEKTRKWTYELELLKR